MQFRRKCYLRRGSGEVWAARPVYVISIHSGCAESRGTSLNRRWADVALGMYGEPTGMDRHGGWRERTGGIISTQFKLPICLASISGHGVGLGYRLFRPPAKSNYDRPFPINSADLTSSYRPLPGESPCHRSPVSHPALTLNINPRGRPAVRAPVIFPLWLISVVTFGIYGATRQPRASMPLVCFLRTKKEEEIKKLSNSQKLSNHPFVDETGNRYVNFFSPISPKRHNKNIRERGHTLGRASFFFFKVRIQKNFRCDRNAAYRFVELEVRRGWLAVNSEFFSHQLLFLARYVSRVSR